MTTERCILCEKPTKFSAIDFQVNVPQGPSFSIRKVPALVCFHCGESYLNPLTTADVNKKSISYLISNYENEMDRIPGNVCAWIRMKIYLSRSKLMNWGDELGLKKIEHDNTHLPREVADRLLEYMKAFLIKN